jgi:hypothetical protein
METSSQILKEPFNRQIPTKVPSNDLDAIRFLETLLD